MKPNQSHLAGLELALEALQDARLWVGSAAVRKLIKQAQSAPEPVQGEAAACVYQWEFGNAWMDTDEKGAADARCEGYKTRTLYTAAAKPDAELVELLRSAQWCMQCSPSCQAGVVTKCGCKKCVHARIDAKLAELQGDKE